MRRSRKRLPLFLSPSEIRAARKADLNIGRNGNEIGGRNGIGLNPLKFCKSPTPWIELFYGALTREQPFCIIKQRQQKSKKKEKEIETGLGCMTYVTWTDLLSLLLVLIALATFVDRRGK